VKLALVAITGLLAFAAIAADGITFGPFKRGAASGTPTISDTFIGREWRCGDETCFAGLGLDGLVWRTGP
jgi:hypothetical protein